MIIDEFACDCGHLSNFTPCICTTCSQTICNDCHVNGVCNLCIEHNSAVNELFIFIEKNVIIIEIIYYDKQKYYFYKKILEQLRTVYNHIINGDSIEIDGEIYNYLTEPKYIYDLIDNSSLKLYNILKNKSESNNFE